MKTALSDGHQSGIQRPHGALPPAAVSVRRAGLADLDAMVSIGLEAMPMDPQWNWRFEHRGRFPEDYERGTRKIYHDFLENRLGNWYVLVAEKPDDRVHGLLQPVAFAVWNVGNLLAALLTAALAACGQSQLGSVGCGDAKTRPNQTPAIKGLRRDANPERMKAWREAMCQAKAQIFDAQLGRNYFQLQVLATRPAFQRQGTATELCRWGIEAARCTGLAIAVFASPMGRVLYGHLGFQWCDSVRIRVLGDEQEIEVAAMVYRPKAALLDEV